VRTSAYEPDRVAPGARQPGDEPGSEGGNHRAPSSLLGILRRHATVARGAWFRGGRPSPSLSEITRPTSFRRAPASRDYAARRFTWIGDWKLEPSLATSIRQLHQEAYLLDGRSNRLRTRRHVTTISGPMDTLRKLTVHAKLRRRTGHVHHPTRGRRPRVIRTPLWIRPIVQSANWTLPQGERLGIGCGGNPPYVRGVGRRAESSPCHIEIRFASREMWSVLTGRYV